MVRRAHSSCAPNTIQCVRQGYGVPGPGLIKTYRSLYRSNKNFYEQHFALPSMSLIFLGFSDPTGVIRACCQILQIKQPADQQRL